MLTIKQFAVRHLTEDVNIADKIGKLCSEDQILAFINGELCDVKINEEVFAKALDKADKNLKVLKINISPNRLCIEVIYECDGKGYANGEGETSSWKHGDYTNPVTIREKLHNDFVLSRFAEFGIEGYFC